MPQGFKGDYDSELEAGPASKQPQERIKELIVDSWSVHYIRPSGCLAEMPGKDFPISSFFLLTWPFGRRGENCLAKCLNVFHLSFEGLKNYLMVS